LDFLPTPRSVKAETVWPTATAAMHNLGRGSEWFRVALLFKCFGAMGDSLQVTLHRCWISLELYTSNSLLESKLAIEASIG
jgi:hypothetical protein